MEEHFFSSNCFNIKNTLENGQCFRWNLVDKDTYQGVAAGRALRLKQYGDGVLFSCGDEDFLYWRRYFDLDTDYAAIEGRFIHDSIIGDCVKAGTGMHILRQELWEVLISFIISQNNNIKRIKGIIERMCALCGRQAEAYGGTVYFFRRLIGWLQYRLKNWKKSAWVTERLMWLNVPRLFRKIRACLIH